VTCCITDNNNLIDTAGQERFNAISPVYYRRASIITLVYDIRDRTSLEYLQNQYLDVEPHNPLYISKNSILVIIGNKTDLKREVPFHEGLNLAEKYNALFFECSAKKYEEIWNIYSIAATAARIMQLKGTVPIHKGCLRVYHNIQNVLLRLHNKDQLCDVTIAFT
jgi:small GTP-binding protein